MTNFCLKLGIIIILFIIISILEIMVSIIMSIIVIIIIVIITTTIIILDIIIIITFIVNFELFIIKICMDSFVLPFLMAFFKIEIFYYIIDRKIFEFASYLS